MGFAGVSGINGFDEAFSGSRPSQNLIGPKRDGGYFCFHPCLRLRTSPLIALLRWLI
jgi:hypothetical protein